MAVVAEFIGPVTPKVVPAEIKDKWYNTLSLRRDMIYGRLLTKIPDETSFLTKIADASSDVWESFVNPAIPNYYFVTLKQRVKLSGAHSKWLDGVVDAFKAGGRFEQGVSLKKDRIDLLKYTLGNVGVRYLGWGPGYKAVGFITGDLRVTRYVTGTETVTGNPVNAFPEEVVKFVRPTLIAMLTQGAVLALLAEENGLSTLRDQVITQTNTNTDTICTGLKKATYTLVYARLEYDATAGQIKVHSRVES